MAIIGPGVVIDRLVPTDAPALARSHSDPGNARHQGWRSPLSEADALHFIEQESGTEPLLPGSAVQLAIRETAGGDLAGDLYVDRPAAGPWSVEVGITLVPGLHGRGIATRAVTALLDAAFGTDPAGIHRVVAGLDIDNIRSRALFERLGFRLEAHHVRSSRRRDGTFADELIFAMSREQWRRPVDQPVIDHDPHPADIRFLEDRLYEFNVEQTGCTDGQIIASFARDALGRIDAGIAGWSWGGSAEIDLLWVHRDRRHQGMGAALLAAFVAEARRRGCRRVVVASYSFQAPAFYERHGFTRTGVQPDHPTGHDDVHLTLILD